MKTYKQFVAESFLSTVKDPETKKRIKNLIKSGDLVSAYKEFHNSEHTKPHTVWSKKNPKLYPHTWKQFA